MAPDLFTHPPTGERTMTQAGLSQDQLKDAVAAAAIDEIKPWLERGTVLGIGTGSTANLFIDRLAALRDDFRGAVASSDASAERLRGHGIEVFELNRVGTVPFSIAGADEVNAHLHMLKGGGAALPGEKIVAAWPETFTSIPDASSGSSGWASFRCQ